MPPPGHRRLLAFVLLAALVALLAGVWYHRFAGGDATPEERAREKAEELRRRVGDLTHGK